MALDRSVTAQRRAASARRRAAERRVAAERRAARGAGRGLSGYLLAGGTNGNRLLTAQTAAVLLILFAILGVTILRIVQLLSVHMFVGMLLLGPVALKMTSTGYRFTRYYTSNPSYRAAGPPPPAMRLIAPIVVLSTIAVFATGVALLFVGPSSRGTLLPLHKATFVIWIIFTGLHVLGHLAEVPAAISRRYQGRLADRLAEVAEQLPGMQRPAAHALPTSGVAAWDAYGTGRVGRLLSLTAALALGIILAVVSIAWFGPWLHAYQGALFGGR